MTSGTKASERETSATTDDRQFVEMRLTTEQNMVITSMSEAINYIVGVTDMHDDNDNARHIRALVLGSAPPNMTPIALTHRILVDWLTNCYDVPTTDMVNVCIDTLNGILSAPTHDINCVEQIRYCGYAMTMLYNFARAIVFANFLQKNHLHVRACTRNDR